MEERTSTSSSFEFTGERVVPGQVDADLWNEHIARYLFAARLARHKRVLDLACGAGYGAAELAVSAERVVGVDRAGEAVAHAREHYRAANLSFVRASVTDVPLRDGSFQMVTAFEVIEHLSDWRALLSEARRLLAPGGQFVVSTPNKLYYAESRKIAGPNPYHEHEFEFAEFRDALAEFFPHVSLFLQNHSSGVTFQPLRNGHTAEVKMERREPAPESSHFFLAVCALAPQTGSPTFVYVPTTANVLYEREEHIARLEKEIAQKNSWLEKAQSDHQALLKLFRDQQQELEARSKWARQLNDQLDESSKRVLALQDELASEQAAGRDTAAAYEGKLAELNGELEARTKWAHDNESRLTGEIETRVKELGECVKLLDQAEKTVEERTVWARKLQIEIEQLQARLSSVQASRWYRVGRRFGLGPDVR
ncbi:MAG: methyltransferase domain-containing protein [Bryobacteraceae bacterium]